MRIPFKIRNSNRKQGTSSICGETNTTAMFQDNQMEVKSNAAYQKTVSQSQVDEESNYIELIESGPQSHQLLKPTNPLTSVRSDHPSQQVNNIKPVQYTAPNVIIIVLLVLIILLLVVLLVLHFTQKDSCACACDTNSNSAGLAIGNNTTVTNLSLLQNKIDNNSLLLQDKMDHILEQIDSYTINKMDYKYILENKIDNNSLLLQDKMDRILEQIDSYTINKMDYKYILEQIMVNTSRSTGTILQLLNTSLIRDISIPTAATVKDILLVVNELLELQNGSSLFNSIRPVSCKDIRNEQPNSPTGYYHVKNHNIYCNMGELCGKEGGWTRVAHLGASENCPPGLQALSAGGIRVCRRQGNGNGCRSIKFPTNGISYTQICGRVIGYQKGRTNGVNTNNNINGAYIDGVSITRGSPREHVWSYISGISSNTNLSHGCPCNSGAASNNKVQQFVGEHYYCESGNNVNNVNTGTLYTDPLWDGNGCRSREVPCCLSNMLPWFFRDYGNATSTDYLELRVCGSAGWGNEDTPVQLYEIYVK